MNPSNRLPVATQAESRVTAPVSCVVQKFTPPPPPPPKNSPLNQPVSARRHGCATPLAWLFTALALLCFAPANAIAQTLGTDNLALSTIGDLTFNLIFPVTTAGGKIYYYLDHDGSGTTGNGDAVMHGLLDTLFNNGMDTTITQEGTHDGTDDARSAIVGEYTLILPTAAELITLANDSSFDLATITTASRYPVWAADGSDDSAADMHKQINLVTKAEDGISPVADNIRTNVFFQVLPAPGTAPTFGATTIPPQTYPINTATAFSFTLPTASGGLGTLIYTLPRMDGGTPLPTGMSFDADAVPPTISGTPTQEGFGGSGPGGAVLLYTVTDTASQTAALSFIVRTVAVTVDTAAGETVGYVDGAIAASNIGGEAGGDNNNDMRLILPINAVHTVAVTFYDLEADAVPPAPVDVTFSDVAMDIGLAHHGGRTSLPANTTATVCLSTAGVPERRTPAIYRLSSATWELLASATTPTIPGFVCGTTTTFSPFAVGYAPPAVTFDDVLNDALDAQIYRVGQTVALTLPPAAAADNMGMLTYTLTPAASIPAGLSFVSATRTLGGIPTTLTPLVTLTYTAIDDTTAMESLTFTVTVNAALAFDTSTIPAPNSAYTYLPRRAITPLILPPASGGIGSLTYSLTPIDSIPDGLSFDSGARTLGGIPTTVTPLVSLTYTATDDTMVMASLIFTVTVASNTTATTRLNEQILTRASQAMTASTMAAVAARVDAAAGGAGAGVAGTTGAGATPTVAYQFGGQSSLRGLLESHGKAMLEGEMEYERLLDGASLVLPLAAADSDSATTAGAMAFWVGSDNRTLESNEDNLDWDGNVLAVHLGIDRQLSQQMMAGVALSWNQSGFDYQNELDGSSGEYRYNSVNLHPYFGWYPSDELKLWGTLGYGQGEIEIETDVVQSTDSAQLSLSGGFSRQVLSSTDLLPGGATTLDLKGDVSLTSVDVEEKADFAAQEVGSTRLRVLVSGEQQRGLASGGRLTPSVEAGVRYDGGDGVTGVGVELGGGLRYANPGGNLSVAGNVRTLLVGEYDELGVDFTVQLAPGSGRGLSLTLRPVWGKTQSAAERLWNDGASEITGGDTALRGSVDTEVGYGMSATMLGSPGLLTPYAGMMATEDGNRLRLGSRFVGGNGLSLNLEGAQENATDGASHQVLLRGEVGF